MGSRTKSKDCPGDVPCRSAKSRNVCGCCQRRRLSRVKGCSFGSASVNSDFGTETIIAGSGFASDESSTTWITQTYSAADSASVRCSCTEDCAAAEFGDATEKLCACN